MPARAPGERIESRPHAAASASTPHRLGLVPLLIVLLARLSIR